MKRKGARTVPCGAPTLQVQRSDTQSRALTNWGRFVRYTLICLPYSPLIAGTLHSSSSPIADTLLCWNIPFQTRPLVINLPQLPFAPMNCISILYYTILWGCSNTLRVWETRPRLLKVSTFQPFTLNCPVQSNLQAQNNNILTCFGRLKATNPEIWHIGKWSNIKSEPSKDMFLYVFFTNKTCHKVNASNWVTLCISFAANNKCTLRLELLEPHGATETPKWTEEGNRK